MKQVNNHEDAFLVMFILMIDCIITGIFVMAVGFFEDSALFISYGGVAAGIGGVIGMVGVYLGRRFPSF